MLVYDYVKAPAKKSPGSGFDKLTLHQLKKLMKPNLKINAKSSTKQKDLQDEINLRFQATLKLLQTTECDENDEDATEKYVTTLKMLIMEISTGDMHLLLDPKMEDSPVIRSLQKYGHHENSLVKNTARLCFLTIFKECEGDIKKYIVNCALSRHFKNIISFLKRSIVCLQNTIDATDEASVDVISGQLDEEFEYIDDILCLENIAIAVQARSIMLKDFVFAIIFEALTRHQNTIRSLKIALLLMIKLLQVTTNREFKESILSFFIPIKLSATSMKNIFPSGRSYERVIKLRHQIIRSLKDAIFSLESNALPLFAVRLLHALSESFISFKDMDGIFLLHKTYFDSLITFLHIEENPYLRFKTTMLNLIALLFEQITIVTSKTISKRGRKFRMHLSQRLKKLYLRTCQKVKFNSVPKFVSTVDKAYKTFLAEKEIRTEILKAVYLFDGNEHVGSSTSQIQTERDRVLLFIFYMRIILLHINEKREKVLPLMKNKIKVGVTLSLAHSMPCKKLIHNNSFASAHFLILTSSQILILQGVGNDAKGKVIFSSYYKDIEWAKFKDNCLVLCKNCQSQSEDTKSDPMRILLKFESTSKVQTIVKILPRAFIKQNIEMTRKLSELKLRRTPHSCRESKYNLE